MQILIADDSELVRHKLAMLIAKIPGIELVAEASNVDQALESIDRLQPDLVIVDLHMPGSGLRLIDTVGARTPHPTMLVLTNHPYPQYRARCLKAGAEYFFDKATEFDGVVRVLTDMAQASIGSERSL
ncbi:MAG TPA: response regulator transcription factor [Anaerolineales bacterium]|nr:response regulator transcription factor [Anaerolineales bacterium]